MNKTTNHTLFFWLLLSDVLNVTSYAAGLLLSYVRFLQGVGRGFRENNMFDYYFPPIRTRNRHRYMHIHNLDSVIKNYKITYIVVLYVYIQEENNDNIDIIIIYKVGTYIRVGKYTYLLNGVIWGGAGTLGNICPPLA